MSPAPRIARLASIGLTVGNAAPLIAFYGQAFGFEVVGAERLEAGLCERLMGAGGGATVTTLRLGRETIEMARFDEPGSPYPPEASAADLIFQHFAIVVSDMARAYERLRGLKGWTPISVGGPRRLPPSSGGVTAYKFRDPEGHPLELLAFPADRTPPRWADVVGGGPCLGIDHSAISVSSGEASLAFYQSLGLSRVGGSLNRGREQDGLDGLADTHVEVTALAAEGAPEPHLELLCYAWRSDPPPAPAADNDIAATRLIFEAYPGGDGRRDDRAAVSMRDPDGHRMIIRPTTTRPSGAAAPQARGGG